MYRIIFATIALSLFQNALATPIPEHMGTVGKINLAGAEGDIKISRDDDHHRLNQTERHWHHRYNSLVQPVIQPAATTVVVQRPSLLDSIPVVGSLIKNLPLVGPLTDSILGGLGGGLLNGVLGGQTGGLVNGVLGGGGGGLLGLKVNGTEFNSLKQQMATGGQSPA
ncbi:hypothetical protein CVT25_007002 [Psilocybe cyanescens]|uniref:Glycine zipper 2TM domain-containing protein n=1 Tax=Psilocybe cyanescens TaxID=93625 RepID=A0A409WYG1_PSICY|nr:hypothetical protein CVT25_007002 [Psilocybe cyanescens]